MRTKVFMLLAVAATIAIAIYFSSLNGEGDSRVVLEPGERPSAEFSGDLIDNPSIQPSSVSSTTSLEAMDTASRNSIAGAWLNQLVVQVEDAEGVPVDGATVFVSKSGSAGLEWEDGSNSALRGISNAIGQFQVSPLEPGNDYWVKVVHEDYLSASLGPLSVGASGEHVYQVLLRRNNRVSGTIRDQLSGQPVAGATLTIAPPLGPESSDSQAHDLVAVREVESDDQGFYSFEAVGDGLQQLTCRAENYATQSVRYLRFTADQPASQSKDFELSSGQIIAGVAVGPTGVPIEGVRIAAYAPKSRGESISDAEGRFRIDGLMSAVYVVEAHSHRELQQILDVPAGSQDCVIRFESSGSIAGHVRLPAGAVPTQDFELVLRKLASVESVHGIPIQKDTFGPQCRGAFSIDGVPAGRFLIEVRAAGFASTYYGPFELAPGQQVEGLEIVLSKGAALRGRIVTADGGRPVQGAKIALSESRWEQGKFRQLMGFESGLSLLSLESNSEGEFGAEALTAGSYRVHITHPELFDEILDGVVVVAGESSDLGPIALQQGCLIRGTVLDSNGDPAAGMGVFLRPASSPSASPQAFETDENGRYRIDCAAGAYDLWAAIPPIELIRNGEKPVRIEVSVGEKLEQELPLIGW